MLAILVVLIWGQANVNLTLPDYMAKIINQGILGKNIDKVWSNGLQMLLLTLLGGLCAIAVGFVSAKISTGYVRKLRTAVFVKVEQFSLSEFDSFSSSSLVTRATNDMQQIQNVIAMVSRMAFLAPFMGVGSIIKAHEIAPAMSWIVLAAIGVLVALIVMLFFVVIPKFTLIQKLVDKLSLQMREMLTGIRVVRAYNNDERQQDKFDQTNQESTKLNIFVNRIMMIMQPVMTLIMGLTAMAVVWVGSYQISDGNLQVGNLFALIQYVSQTIMAFLMISIIFIMVPRAAVSFKRVGKILAVEPKINDPKQPKHLPDDIAGTIAFQNVSFGYKGSEHSVLSDISFTAESGQITAIIGGTGSGKSSILKLVPRLYDVTSGSITVDSIDIRDVPQKELHSFIGYVPQKASLFSGTIASNIIYGKPDADSSELHKAAKIAQAKEFIDDLPKKFDSPIAQAGNNVSGGQKQRLAIARAIAKNPKIYLFDDSFSALDFKTDAALRKALEPEIANKTFIVVAQRISTIMHADKIIVLEDGKIVGMGQHHQLLKSCKVYREIAQSQLSAVELSEER
jgi:ATP-binding cassette subfamily B protein